MPICCHSGIHDASDRCLRIVRTELLHCLRGGRRVAKFLEGRGDVAKALEVARDADYRFDLAVQLNDFDVAVGIAEELASPARWKQLGEMALSDGRLPLAQRCLSHSGDLSGMMLMFTATGNRTGMRVRLPPPPFPIPVLPPDMRSRALRTLIIHPRPCR